MFKQYINGKLVNGQGRTIDVIDPANGQVVTSLAGATGKQAVEALEFAKAAFATWSWSSLDERVNWLRKYTRPFWTNGSTLWTY